MANPSAGSAKAAVATPPAAAAPPLKSARRVTVSPSYAPTQPRSAVYGDFFFLRLEGSGMVFAGGHEWRELNCRRHFTVNISTDVTNPCAQAVYGRFAPGFRGCGADEGTRPGAARAPGGPGVPAAASGGAVAVRGAAAARAPGPPTGESAAWAASQSGSIASGRPSASA